MTKKDFELIAQTIRDYTKYNETTEEAEGLALCFANRLRQSNERFNEDKFRAACGNI